MGPAERLRVFYALWPDAATASQLQAWARIGAPASARLMRRDTLHLTLAFVGDVDAARVPELVHIGAQAHWPSFTLNLDRLGHWTHNGIIWAGCSRPPAPLETAADALAARLRAAGFDMPLRRFAPHVTLARKAEALISGAPMPAVIDWPVTGGVLVASDRDAGGAHYRTLAAWPGLSA